MMLINAFIFIYIAIILLYKIEKFSILSPISIILYKHLLYYIYILFIISLIIYRLTHLNEIEGINIINIKKYILYFSYYIIHFFNFIYYRNNIYIFLIYIFIFILFIYIIFYSIFYILKVTVIGINSLFNVASFLHDFLRKYRFYNKIIIKYLKFVLPKVIKILLLSSQDNNKRIFYKTLFNFFKSLPIIIIPFALIFDFINNFPIIISIFKLFPFILIYTYLFKIFSFYVNLVLTETCFNDFYFK